MGRCVIFALGEMLISVLSAATWMDEPGSLQPRLTFPQHLRQTSLWTTGDLFFQFNLPGYSKFNAALT